MLIIMFGSRVFMDGMNKINIGELSREELYELMQLIIDELRLRDMQDAK